MYVECIKEVIDKKNHTRVSGEQSQYNMGNDQAQCERYSTIQYASRKKKNIDVKIKDLMSEINILDMQCKCNPIDESLKIQLQEKEHVLEGILDEKARGIYIRSKAQWMEDGGKSSR